MTKAQKGNRTTYRYTFKKRVSIDEVQDTLILSIIGAECLHGRNRIRLEGRWLLDKQRRTCMIDGSTQVGEDIARLFTGYLSREFGEKSFDVRRRLPSKRLDSSGHLGKVFRPDAE